MKIFTTWQQPALEPRFAMPMHASASSYARTLTCGTTAGVVSGAMGDVRLEAARIKGIFPGSPAWSPPIS